MSFTPKEAPCFKSFMTIPICEFRKAMQRGVSPLKSAWSTAHPCAISQSAQFSLLQRAAAKSRSGGGCPKHPLPGHVSEVFGKKNSRTFVERSASRSKHKTLPMFVQLQIRSASRLQIFRFGTCLKVSLLPPHGGRGPRGNAGVLFHPPAA